MAQGEERRKHVRVVLPEGKVRLLSDHYLILIGRAIDISTGGIKFVSEMKLGIGENINLEIVVPGSMKFKCCGKIVHLESQGNQVVCGASFVGLDDKEKEQLGQFIIHLRALQDYILKEKLK